MGTRTHVYTLRVALAGCRYDVRVNDVPIFRDMFDGYPLVATMAINEYLQSGANTLSVQLLTLPEQDHIPAAAEHFEVAIFGRPAGSPKTADERLMRVALRPGTQDGLAAEITAAATPLLRSNPQVDVSGDRIRSLAARTAFALPPDSFVWNWLHSDPIPDTPQTFREVSALFEDWVERLERKDAGWIGAAFRERTAELTQALFEPRAAVENHGLYDAVADPSLTLVGPGLDKAKLMIFGNGRLARLVRWDEAAIIAYLHADGETATYFPLILRKAGEHWIVCR